MLRSIGAEIKFLQRGAVESAVNSFEWLTDIMPHAIAELIARMKKATQERSVDFYQWAIEGYDVRQQVIYTNELGYRITAVILSKRLNDLNEYEYEISIIPGRYYMDDIYSGNETDDRPHQSFKEQVLTVLHTSLRKGK